MLPWTQRIARIPRTVPLYFRTREDGNDFVEELYTVQPDLLQIRWTLRGWYSLTL